MNKETLKISELIKELEYFKSHEGDIECFVLMEEDEEFLGIQKAFVMKTLEGATYLAVITNGDVLKMPAGDKPLGFMKYEDKN